MDWQTTASISALKKRAEMLRSIREFFFQRKVLEVETPLLCQFGVTDLHVDNFVVPVRSSIHAQIKPLSRVSESSRGISSDNSNYYLQTSPEYAMKRLLASGSGSIFQICKAFRYGESGRKHNPEFTMLEWYREGFDHHQLMEELGELIQLLLNCEKPEKYSYQRIFEKHIGVNPHNTQLKKWKKCLSERDIRLTEIQLNELNEDTAQQILLTHLIEPFFSEERPVFIYDFPASQAALAKIRQDEFSVAERFELYYKGQELANGFHELQHHEEQEKRFIHDQKLRVQHQKNKMRIDYRLIDALKCGLPNCSGVAMGLDRLLMLQMGVNSISDVLAFDWEHA